MTDILEFNRNGAIRSIGDSKARNDIAPNFTTTIDYEMNDLVMYDGQLYKFIADHSAGMWDINSVTTTSIKNELINMQSNWTVSTIDLVDGVSVLKPNEIYFYYGA